MNHHKLNIVLSFFFPVDEIRPQLLIEEKMLAQKKPI